MRKRSTRRECAPPSSSVRCRHLTNLTKTLPRRLTLAPTSIPFPCAGVLATNITDAITHHRRALQISVTMSKEHRDARVVGPDPKDTTSFTKDTKLLSPKQGDGELLFISVLAIRLTARVFCS